MESKFDLVDQRVRELIEELNAIGYNLHHTAWAGGYLPRDEKHVVVKIHKSSRFNGMVIESPLSCPSNYHARIYLVKGVVKNEKTDE